jgi:hypothetical protein
LTGYFSDREHPQPQLREEVAPSVWAGLVALFNAALQSGAFGAAFPERCQDGQAICGNDSSGVAAAVSAYLPQLTWPLETMRRREDSWETQPYAPPTPVVMDFVEFVYQHIAAPVQQWHHDYYRHDHLTFEIDSGRRQFREKVNLLFVRNQLAYELDVNGHVERTLSPVLEQAVASPIRTGDTRADAMVVEAIQKLHRPEVAARKEGLERLWDVFERIKTFRDADKKTSVKLILDHAATEATMRSALEAEMRALTELGNGLTIRHHEMNKAPLDDAAHVDYLFQRMYALLDLIVKKNVT